MSHRVDIYLIADDPVPRNNIATLFDGADFRVREFESTTKFLRLAPSLEPGYLISDVRSADNDALPMLENLKAGGLDFRVILITRKGDVGLAVNAMRVGAADVLEWPVTRESLISIIRRAQGERGADRSTAELADVATRRLALLTPRELDVLKRLVGGLPNKLIAYDLEINIRTVEFYRARTMKKMRAENFSDLIRFALAAGVRMERNR